MADASCADAFVDTDAVGLAVLAVGAVLVVHAVEKRPSASKAEKMRITVVPYAFTQL
ncbi:MAG: hypothetical protein AAFR98_13075 [Pseudomonadota bacterium]